MKVISTTKTLVLLVVFFSSINITSASLEYSSKYGVSFSTSDNIHTVPQLYSAFVNQTNESYVQQNILNETSPKVWWISTCLITPSEFYINDSTVIELRLGTGQDWHYYTLAGSPIVENTKLVCWDAVSNAPGPGGYLSINTPFHDVIIKGFYKVMLSDLSNSSLYNISMDSTAYGLCFSNGNHLAVNNVTIRNGAPLTGGGITTSTVNDSSFSNIYAINCSNNSNPATGAYGFFIVGSNNSAKNIYVNGTAWSGMLFGGTNWTAYNLTSINAGHNGIENEAVNNSVFDKMYILNANQHNLFLKGAEYSNPYTCDWMENDTYSNITSSNYIDDNGILGAFNRNITIKDSVFTLGGSGFTDLNGVNNTFINCTVHDTNSFGLAFQSLDLGFGSYSSGNRVIDCHFTNCNSHDVWVIDGNVIVINPSADTNIVPYQKGSGSNSTVYYYPNIKVIDAQRQPVSNAAITANTTVRNGYGIVQTTFYTDSSGMLSAADRNNFMAIPDEHTDFSTTTSYVTQITASKDGHNNSTIVDPSSSWYSSNPSSLHGPEVVITLDTGGWFRELIYRIMSIRMAL